MFRNTLRMLEQLNGTMTYKTVSYTHLTLPTIA